VENHHDRRGGGKDGGDPNGIPKALFSNKPASRSKKRNLWTCRRWRQHSQLEIQLLRSSEAPSHWNKEILREILEERLPTHFSGSKKDLIIPLTGGKKKKKNITNSMGETRQLSKKRGAIRSLKSKKKKGGGSSFRGKERRQHVFPHVVEKRGRLR